MSEASDSDEGNEIRVVSDQVWIKNLSPKEAEWLKENQIPSEELEDRKVVCTSCFKQGNHKQKGFFVRHPSLGVPICKSCHNFYFEGSWRKDEDGKFEYCGWCAQGGELLCCAKDKCPNAFCTKCVKRNLGRQAVTNIEESEEWHCFECKPNQLNNLRCLFFSIYQFWKKVDEKVASKEKAKKVKARTDCITKSLGEAKDSNNLDRKLLNKLTQSWLKITDPDPEPAVKLEAGEKFAHYLAVCQKNLNQLQARFFDHLETDLGPDKERTERLTKIIQDLDTISNGHLEELELKKEKAKFQVLKDSDESDVPNGNDAIVELSDESTEDDDDSDIEQVEVVTKRRVSKPKPSSATNGKKSTVKIRIGRKARKDSSSEEGNVSDKEEESVKKVTSDCEEDHIKANLPKKKKKKNQSDSEEEFAKSESAVEEKCVRKVELSTNLKESGDGEFQGEISPKVKTEEAKSEEKNCTANVSKNNLESVKKESDVEEEKPKIKKAAAESPTKTAIVLETSSDDDCEKARKQVLETSSDEEEVTKKSNKKKVKKAPVKAVDNSSDEEEEESQISELRAQFNKHIKSIDVAKDTKLKSKAVVIVDRLSSDSFKEGETSILLPKEEEEASKKRSKPKKNQFAKFDAEINRLCDLGGLEKLAAKRGRSEKKTHSSKAMKNGKSKAIVEKASDIEMISDDKADDSDPEILTLSSPSIKKSSKDRAKEAVLASSSSEKEEDEEVKSTKKSSKSKAVEEKSSHKVGPKSKTSKEEPSFMRTKLGETDSEEEVKKRKAKKKANLKESDDEELPVATKSKKGRRAKKVVDSSGDEFQNPESANQSEEEEEEKSVQDEEDSDSDIGVKKKVANSKGKKKRKKKSSSSAASSSGETSDDEPRQKKKRRRIKNDDSSANEEENESPTKSGRKDIRKIIKDKKLSKDTREAAVIERERRKRMEDRQKVYNELYEIKDNAVVKEVPLDIDAETKKILVQVHPKICEKLKPHQARGIKFIWDAVFESKKDVESGKVPGGAILAHCMGLGKTLQTIGLVHTLMTNFPKHIRHVLILAPVNTLKNWEDEFFKWLVGDLEDDVEVFEVSGEKDNWARSDRLKYWQKNGGALIMGYDMFRNLTNENTKKFKKKQREIFQETLVNPGPDIVICDEGHVLKNTKSALNHAMNRIKTRRRVVLTGTPLQNNLSEYFAMVDFVKPKLLGTFNEFRNRFVNPITNGQNSDSTDRDVRVMKKRSFILSDLLKGCMQRLDYNVLVPFLQPKYEYVLCICLTEFQKKLYEFYLQNYARAGQIGSEGKLEGGKKGGLFYDVQNLSRVWNHPYILLKAKEKADIARVLQEDAEEDENFIDDDDDEESEAKSTSSDDDDDDAPVVVKKRRIATRNKKDDSEELLGGLEVVKADALASDRGWWSRFMKNPEDEDELMNVELGSKMILLMDILKECYMIGDKVLVFSQSLLSLDLIETFLFQASTQEEVYGSWTHGKDYFRMDGSTPPDVRKKWCSYFNKPSNTDMRLFLISTKAGGLGINLVAANRVIIFDASWNPAHDVQSIFRVYRFGQEKPVYIYRFLAKGTMEEKIYDRQVTKQSLSARVVDEQQIERHFSMNELAELYTYRDEPKENRPIPKVPQDKLLAELLVKHEDLIWRIHDHDSLLENQVDEHLTEEERKAAWEEFENEKKGIVNMATNNSLNMNLVMSNINPEMIRTQYKIQYPHLTDDQVNQATRAYMMQIQSAYTRKPAYDKSFYAQEMAKARQHQQQLYPGMFGSSKGARQADEVSAQELNITAQQLLAYQRLMQMQRVQQLQQQTAATQGPAVLVRAKPPQATIVKKKSNQPPETITLDEDDEDIQEVPEDDDEDDGGEIVLEGAPEIEEYQPMPSTSKRRGRPRLDPETDPLD